MRPARQTEESGEFGDVIVAGIAVGHVEISDGVAGQLAVVVIGIDVGRIDLRRRWVGITGSDVGEHRFDVFGST